MKRLSLSGLGLALLFALHGVSLAASPLPRLLQDSIKRSSAHALVTDFFKAAIDGKERCDSLMRFATGTFADKLKGMQGDTLWKVAPQSYAVGNVYAIRDGDSILMVTATVETGMVPRFGPLEIDWVFFLEPNEDHELRISTLHRMVGVDKNVEALKYIDTSGAYPSSIKPTIIREMSSMLLSNRQLREHFLSNRSGFDALLAEFSRKDSLRMLARTDRKVSQLNRFTIDWGIASQEMPKDAIDEYLKTATPEQRRAVEQQLKVAEKIRRSGLDTLARIARKSKLDLARIDSTIDLMQQLRISFVNRDLPWPDAVQFTVAGRFGNALGYLYSPHGEVPYINPSEYYYLEEIGDGWWIFRTT